MALSERHACTVARICADAVAEDPALLSHSRPGDNEEPEPGALVIAVLLKLQDRLGDIGELPPPHAAELREAAYQIYDAMK